METWHDDTFSEVTHEFIMFAEGVVCDTLRGFDPVCISCYGVGGGVRL